MKLMCEEGNFFFKSTEKPMFFFFCRGKNKRNCCEVLSKQPGLKLF